MSTKNSKRIRLCMFTRKEEFVFVIHSREENRAASKEIEQRCEEVNRPRSKKKKMDIQY